MDEPPDTEASEIIRATQVLQLKLIVMTSKTALPPTLAPRLLNREASAAYSGVSPSTFDLMVKGRTMPKAKVVFGRRIAWDIRQLDVAIENLPTAGEDSSSDNTWDDIDATQTASIR